MFPTTKVAIRENKNQKYENFGDLRMGDWFYTAPNSPNIFICSEGGVGVNIETGRQTMFNVTQVVFRLTYVEITVDKE